MGGQCGLPFVPTPRPRTFPLSELSWLTQPQDSPWLCKKFGGSNWVSEMFPSIHHSGPNIVPFRGLLLTGHRGINMSLSLLTCSQDTRSEEVSPAGPPLSSPRSESHAWPSKAPAAPLPVTAPGMAQGRAGRGHCAVQSPSQRQRVAPGDISASS